MNKHFAWLLVFGLQLLGCGTPTTVVQTGNNERAYGLTVVGNAELKVKPDIAKTSLGVEARATTVQAAEEQVNSRMRAILAALKSHGVEGKDVQTSNYSINFEQEHPGQPYGGPVMEGEVSKQESAPDKSQPKGPVRPVPEAPRGHYRVNNQLNVTIRDLGKLGAILNAATNAGANNIWGISFELDNPRAFENEAREKAMADAKSRASTLAELSGATLGSILAVSESTGDRVYPRMAMEAHMLKSDSRQSVPVEQGEIVVSHQVQLTYALK